MKWSSERRKLADLKENERNPRYIDKRQMQRLEKSIARFGMCEPIVVNLDGTIISGHQRFRALKKAKVTEESVYVPERILDEKDVSELTVILNDIHGGFDADILANQWEIEELLSYGMDMAKLFGEDEPVKKKRFRITIDCADETELSQYEQELMKLYPYAKIKSKAS